MDELLEKDVAKPSKDEVTVRGPEEKIKKVRRDTEERSRR